MNKMPVDGDTYLTATSLLNGGSNKITTSDGARSTPELIREKDGQKERFPSFDLNFASSGRLETMLSMVMTSLAKDKPGIENSDLKLNFSIRNEIKSCHTIPMFFMETLLPSLTITWRQRRQHKCKTGFTFGSPLYYLVSKQLTNFLSAASITSRPTSLPCLTVPAILVTIGPITQLAHDYKRALPCLNLPSGSVPYALSSVYQHEFFHDSSTPFLRWRDTTFLGG
jgi:hypothetical protein